MIARETVPIPAYTDEVVRGLTAPQKTLPCKLLYDDTGSALFEEITRLPEYYLTRTELEILRKNSRDISLAAGSPISVVELGAGTATKTETLLRAIARRQMRVKYFPVDISPSALAEARNRLRTEFPGALIKPVVADFSNGFQFLKDIVGKKLVLYLGSSIGNFEWNDAVALLRKVRDQLVTGDALLLGTDMAKAEEILVPAYDDAKGITQQFTRNILRRLNRELSANFELEAFRHIAEWSPDRSRMEISLESTRPQTVSIGVTGTRLHFRAGERIHTEISSKYTVEMVKQMFCVSGFDLTRSWFDKREWFGLHLASVR
jgi:L-histidine N-alpha-methyltransferase